MYWVGIIGMWVFSDGLLSWILYRNKESYRGDRQTFKKDHWIRLVRCVVGVALIIIGAICSRT